MAELARTDLTPLIGSQVHLEKAALLSGDHAPEIRALLVERGAIVVRDVHLSGDELRNLARTLGDLRLGTAKRGSDGKTLTEGDEGVMRITLDPEKNPEYARFLFGNELWHMDGTYSEGTPPFATMLAPVALSQRGGDTLFANTYAAFEALPEAEQRELEQLEVVHSLPAALFPGKRDVSAEEYAVWASYPRNAHPLVWQHKSGRKSLVIGTQCSHVVGMHRTESHDLLHDLMRHATQDRFVYRHKWRLGDVAIWDNTGTIHRAMPYEENSEREMLRATLNGEEPVTGVGQRAAAPA
jgi:alpha-ketoglutarate-dependent taurine dioxygenase